MPKYAYVLNWLKNEPVVSAVQHRIIRYTVLASEYLKKAHN